MAKNQSLPAHLQEKDSRGEENLTMYEHPGKLTAWWPRPSLSNPRSTNDIVWAFLQIKSLHLIQPFFQGFYLFSWLKSLFSSISRLFLMGSSNWLQRFLYNQDHILVPNF